jgi:5-methylcytosine-specific restriction endonuclease McrA
LLVHEKDWHAHRATHKRTGSTPALKRARLELISQTDVECTDCHRHKHQLPDGVALEVHHVDGDWRNDDMGNLRVVCTDCHDRSGHMWWAEDMLPNRSQTSSQRPRTVSSRPPASSPGPRLA